MEILLTIRQLLFTPFAFLMGFLGTILRPILPFLSNGFIQLLLLIVFIALTIFLLYDFKNEERCTLSDLNYEVKLSALPLVVAFLLGMHFESSIHMSIGGEPDILVTFFNFMYWPWMPQMYLIIFIITSVFSFCLYTSFSLRMGIRFICSLLVSIFAGNLYMSIFVLIQMASQEIRGIFYLLGVIANMIHPIVEGLIAGPLLAGGVFALFRSVESAKLAALRKQQHEKWKNQRQSNKPNKSNTSSPFTVFDLPNVINGPYNNKYVQSFITSEYAEYQCVETKELIKIYKNKISAKSACSSDGEHFWW